VTGLLETILYGTGIAAIFLTPDGNGNSVASSVIGMIESKSADAGVLAGLPNQVVNGLGSAALPIAGGLILSIISRKFHLRSATLITKKLAAV
jgi:hypothetical protein